MLNKIFVSGILCATVMSCGKPSQQTSGLADVEPIQPVEFAQYKDGPYLVTRIDDSIMAEGWYNGLKLPEVKGKSGTQRIFESSGKEIKIICTHSIIPPAAYSCEFRMSFDARISDGNNQSTKLEIDIHDNDAKVLFEAFQTFPTVTSRGVLKSEEDRDDVGKSVGLSCYKQNLNNAHGCTLTFESPVVAR